MPNGLIIFIVIVVLSAVIGAISQLLKNQQQAEQAARARVRATDRERDRDRDLDREGAAAGKTGSGDIDRFLEEIDKLRRKAAGAPGQPAAAAPVAKRAQPVAVPTVEPAKKSRPSDLPSRAFEVTAAPSLAAPPSRASAPVQPRQTQVRVEELPVAPVVAATSRAVARPAGPRSPSQGPKTDFARQLAGLLGSKNGVPLAVVLQEVLAEPKCRRR